MTATPEASCRVDVWLWRARFSKTRGLAAALIESGSVRLTRGTLQTRLDKPARSVQLGDRLMFVQAGRVVDLEVLALGHRRGPAAEARALYALVDPPG